MNKLLTASTANSFAASRQLWTKILAFSDDRRCDHILATGFALSVLTEQQQQQHAWQDAKWKSFLGVAPPGADELYLMTVEASVDKGCFRFDWLFDLLNALPSPGEAAIVVAMFYADLMDARRERDAKWLRCEIGRRVALHLSSASGSA